MYAFSKIVPSAIAVAAAAATFCGIKSKTEAKGGNLFI